MPFIKGQIGNPEGRPKGKQNRTTLELKELLIELINKEIEFIPERLDCLTEKERLEILIKLLPYVLPKCMDEIRVSSNEINIPVISWISNK